MICFLIFCHVITWNIWDLHLKGEEEALWVHAGALLRENDEKKLPSEKALHHLSSHKVAWEFRTEVQEEFGYVLLPDFSSSPSGKKIHFKSKSWKEGSGSFNVMSYLAVFRLQE